jgi:hypothetical protein
MYDIKYAWHRSKATEVGFNNYLSTVLLSRFTAPKKNTKKNSSPILSNYLSLPLFFYFISLAIAVKILTFDLQLHSRALFAVFLFPHFSL